jgi:hypothetical protein
MHDHQTTATQITSQFFIKRLLITQMNAIMQISSSNNQALNFFNNHLS